MVERQGELVGNRHRLNDGPLLLVRVRELAVALHIACKCVTQRAEDARLLSLGKQRHERRGVEPAAPRTRGYEERREGLVLAPVATGGKIRISRPETAIGRREVGGEGVAGRRVVAVLDVDAAGRERPILAVQRILLL